MVTRRDLLIVVLATFCLTATIFSVIPTRSQNNKYDTWLDINDDGTINILDISASAKAFGSSGDPTKNVNVTNWPQTYSLQRTYVSVNVSWSAPSNTKGFNSPIIDVGGFSRMTILFNVENMSLGSTTYNMSINLKGVEWTTLTSPVGWLHDNIDMQNYFNANVIRTNTGWPVEHLYSMSIETKAPYAWLEFSCGATAGPGWAVLDFYIYLRNE